ncbi:MAG: FG-GAP repeat protein [Deltaproteobacteria bacterium]|nr:FG-GAP repeat protein [Deltaproteobacteria bacterium]
MENTNKRLDLGCFGTIVAAAGLSVFGCSIGATESMDSSATETTSNIRIPKETIRLLRTGQIDENAGTYLYAPSIMFDEKTHMYRLWACGSSELGDVIIFKSGKTLDDLNASPWTRALTPSVADAVAFDYSHTCDPSVIRVGDLMYLYYGGINMLEPEGHRPTRLSVAVSTDNGASFTRLHEGRPLVGPAWADWNGGYGIGQPAVVFAHGMYYMVYTYAWATDSMLRVIRSADPAFSTYEHVRDLWNGSTAAALSVDLVYDQSNDDFLLVTQHRGEYNPDRLHGSQVLIYHFDRDFFPANYNNSAESPITVADTHVSDFDASPDFLFGEGAGIVTNSRRELLRSLVDGKQTVTFAASTFLGPEQGINGPMMYATYVISDGGFVNMNAKTQPGHSHFTTGDFDGDGQSDVLVQNDLTGDVELALFDGLEVRDFRPFYEESNTAWRIVGSADFDGDGHDDILWHNNQTGVVYLMLLRFGERVAERIVYQEQNLDWSISGVASRDNSGRVGVLWRNRSTGQVWKMLMTSFDIVEQGLVYTESKREWQIVGYRDFDGDRHADILWRNNITGDVYLVLLQGLSVSGQGFVYREPNLAWRIAAVGDLNGDGKADIVWRADETGSVYALLMNGLNTPSGNPIYQEASLDWRIVGTGDFGGDEKDDIFWYNRATGQTYQLAMNGLNVAGGAETFPRR